MNYKIVNFHKYCLTCKHREVKDTEEPCAECVSCPARVDSRKPINYEEDEKKVAKLRKN